MRSERNLGYKNRPRENTVEYTGERKHINTIHNY